MDRTPARAGPGGVRGGSGARGRRKVREALDIAALTATRRLPSLVALRQHMRAAGKAPTTILIAAGRRLLVILNAMIRSGQPIAARGRRHMRNVGPGAVSAGRDGRMPRHQPSMPVSPQTDTAWPEIMRPRGEARNSTWSAICSGVT